MTCGKLKFVFQQYQQLSFTVVSSNGESESFLRSQLRLLYEMLLMVFGPKTLHEKKQVNFMKHQKFMQKLIDTMCWQSENNQSMLVESIELLEVNEALRGKVHDALKVSLDSSPSTIHGILLVGSKLLGIYTKPKVPELYSSDILLLILYVCGLFHPHVSQREDERKMPVADYTDHQGIQSGASRRDENERPLEESASSSLDEGFVSATEDWEEEVKDGNDDMFMFLMHPELSGILEMIVQAMQSHYGNDVKETRSALQNVLLSLLSTVPDPTEKKSDPVQVENSGKEEVENINPNVLKMKTLSTLVQQGISEESSLEEVQMLQSLLSLGHCYTGPIDGILGKDTSHAIRTFQSQNETNSATISEGADKELIRTLIYTIGNNIDTDTDNDDSHLTAQSGSAEIQKEEKLEFFKEPISPMRKVTSPLFTKSSHKRSGSQGSPRASPSTQNFPKDPTPPPPEKPKEEEHKDPPVKKKVYSIVHLRSPSYNPYWVYCAEIEQNVSLILVTRNMSGNDDEREELHRVQNSVRSILKNYLDYLIIRETTHLSVLSYVHQLPGLIHFIFVDRSLNKIISPTIGQLHGQQCIPDEDTSLEMVKLLKKKVWEMCYQAQKYLQQGYSTMLIKAGDFQYSHRLWLEDSDGIEVQIEHNFSQLSIPINNSFYRDLVKRTPRATKCYELFSLYLGYVSVPLVASHERH
eukprot:TRINITY_DN9775_c0_g1_i1.p1 TRINITY_DN9775_c0_g1~~TRINITY_DN9775_c0_g1_i1.p1  ORF type:complete len:745 (-),score=195.48 TRINITY_DN9775_c0_g1_i1:57-2144(-)